MEEFKMANARIEKKHKELDKNVLANIMIENRTFHEWKYAKDIPYFKNVHNYKRSVKYRLKEHMRTGNKSMIFREINGKPKNFDYISAAFSDWVDMHMFEIIFDDMNPIDRYNIIKGDTSDYDSNIKLRF